MIYIIWLLVVLAVLALCYADEQRARKHNSMSRNRDIAEKERTRMMREIEFRRKWRNKLK